MYRQDNSQDGLKATIFTRFNQLQLYTWACLLLGVFIFMSARTIMLFYFGDISQMSTYGRDLLHAYKLGFLFDIQVLVYGFLLFFILGSLVLAKQSIFTAYQRIYHFIAIILLDICLFVAIVNFYFYQYFNSRINEIILNLNNGRVDAILVSVWNHYPLLAIAIILFVASYVFHRVLRFVERHIAEVYWKPVQTYIMNFSFMDVFIIP